MDSPLLGKALRLVGVGWYVAICIGGGAAGGFWIDSRLDLRPVFTIIGLGLGIALAIIGMFRMLMVVLSDTSDPGDDREG